MSEHAEGYRKAMKEKANRLAGGKTVGAVDASGWKPEGSVELLHSEKKNGPSQPKPRAFKDGGKVEGEKAHHHAGRAKRGGGGPLGGESAISDPTVAAAASNATQNRAGVQPTRMSFNSSGNLMGLKKGGEAKHPDAKEDKALIKSMVRPTALREARKNGGTSDEADPAFKKGGRAERKHGGKVKGSGKDKMNVNIIITPQPPQGQQQPPGAPGPALSPSPPPPPPGPAAPVAPGAAPMAVNPAPGLGGAGPQMPHPPMGRKYGGRAYPISDGAGGGEGRKEKARAYGLTPAPGESV